MLLLSPAQSPAAAPPLQDDREADGGGVERHGPHHHQHVRLQQHLQQRGRLHRPRDRRRDRGLLPLPERAQDRAAEAAEDGAGGVQEDEGEEEDDRIHLRE